MQRLSRLSRLSPQSRLYCPLSLKTQRYFVTSATKPGNSTLANMFKHYLLCTTRQGNHYHLDHAIRSGDSALAKTVMTKEYTDNLGYLTTWIPYYIRFTEKNLKNREARLTKLPCYFQDPEVMMKRLAVSTFTLYPWCTYVSFLYKE